MQRIIALILISLITLSCSNDIQFNTPLFQGTKNYELWTIDNLQAAFTDNGGVKIIGIKNNESLTLLTESIDVGTYQLGSTNENSATFEDYNFISYSTTNNGDGEITIQNYDANSMTISGSFSFNSYSSNGELINFIDGIFYNIPIIATSSELTGSNSFNATVNSNNVEVSTVETNISNAILEVKAINVDGSYIEIFMPEDISMGSYTLSSTSIYATYGFTDGVIASSQYGTLTILDHDTQFKKIKASFLFNTGNPHNIEVSNGNFIVYY